MVVGSRGVLQHGKSTGSNDHVKVFVRIRPFNLKEVTEAEGDLKATLVVNSDTSLCCINPKDESRRHVFPFDLVLWSVPQEQIKDTAVKMKGQADVFTNIGLPILNSSFDGYNGCVFAYGQTSSGMPSPSSLSRTISDRQVQSCMPLQVYFVEPCSY